MVISLEVKQLFHFATSATHFVFKAMIFDVDGVAMGSPSGPVLVNMGYHERN